MASKLGSSALPCWEMARIESDSVVSIQYTQTVHVLSPSRAGFLYLHAACHNFAGLFVVRFFLGTAEACVVPSFLLILSMFFTYDEQAVLMPCMWAIGNSSPITSGLLSYGVLFIKTGSFAPWKWFMSMYPSHTNAQFRK
jgi:MFS family permease